MDYHPIADVIAFKLLSRSVLLAGPLAQAMSSALLERGVASSLFHPDRAPHRHQFDLAAFVGEEHALPPESFCLAAHAVLLCPADPDRCLLEAFAGWGFVPDLRALSGCRAPGALLMRELPDTSAEVESLKREVRQLFIAVERRSAGFEQLAGQHRDLTLAVGDLSRSLSDVTESRIWQVLRFLGALALAGSALIPRRRRTESTALVGSETDAPAYKRWIEEVEAPRTSAPRTPVITGPAISIIMPVGGGDSGIERTIESVRLQNYGPCELIIVPYQGKAPRPSRVEALASDQGLHLRRLDQAASLARAWNAGLETASGEYVALVDAGDTLSPDALLSLSRRIRQHPDTDVLYSDEDRIDAAGRRFLPFFKPEWSPDLLHSQNYLGRLLVLRRSLAGKAGGFREDLEAAHDYDLSLRLHEQGARIERVPGILYHRYTGTRPLADATTDRAEWKALESHLRRTSPGASVEEGVAAGRRRVRYPLPSDPGVSVLIPSGGNVTMLAENLQELIARTDYPRYELVIIDNSTGEGVARLVDGWPPSAIAVRRVDWRSKPFNFPALCNAGARTCRSPFLLFLNDDTKVIDHGWLRALVELGARREVGAVGAKLLFPDGSIQHAGVVLGLFGRSGHAFKGLDGSKRHYFDFPDVIRNVSALTGACLLVRAEVFAEVGGFDEDNFPVDSNDIDLCLRIGRAGYRLLYTPHALLFHLEAVSKRPSDLRAHPAEVAAFTKRWRDAILADPFYHPELTRAAEDFSPRGKYEEWPATREE